MKNHQELRTEIIYRLVKAYKELRRVEKLLDGPKMTRVFRTNCKSAKNQAAMRKALQVGLYECQNHLVEIYRHLPEVAHEHMPMETELTEAKEFAALCAKKPRRRKFMKGQGLLLVSQQ